MTENGRKDTAHLKLWKEFKEFDFKGNVNDTDVGDIIGISFTAIFN